MSSAFFVIIKVPWKSAMRTGGSSATDPTNVGVGGL